MAEFFQNFIAAIMNFIEMIQNLVDNIRKNNDPEIGKGEGADQ